MFKEVTVADIAEAFGISLKEAEEEIKNGTIECVASNNGGIGKE